MNSQDSKKGKKKKKTKKRNTKGMVEVCLWKRIVMYEKKKEKREKERITRYLCMINHDPIRCAKKVFFLWRETNFPFEPNRFGKQILKISCKATT